VGTGVQPTAERWMLAEVFGFSGEAYENGLGDILREVLVASNHPQSGRIDMIDMSPDNLRKGRFVPSF
jgi:hypothetical protein